MTTIIVSHSRSPHQNTRRVADVFAEELDAAIITPEDATPDVVASADLVGFGSGIYFMNFAAELRQCVSRLSDMSGRRAFVFATSGLPQPPVRRYVDRFTGELRRRGFTVEETLLLRGYDTWGPTRVVGGLNKDRPDAADLDRADDVARRLKHRANATE
ncbi:flavodoxin domain-containing protein [Williamsia sterculiae]|uniref:Flavodoxin n=1 Tax=Williamsia sterculiae TaxID=1344003 RepID=A0A1N7END4_9NOCA|nr:flavodoxin domain-containing protein [Williamsia sterculiae]SIR89569.1 Flavodoxin [Williamsia sterculiae]